MVANSVLSLKKILGKFFPVFSFFLLRRRFIVFYVNDFGFFYI